MKSRRLRHATARCCAPISRIAHADHGETFVEAIVSMSILALIMSVSAPAFVATQKLNRQNQASATTLSYAETYIDDFRQTIASLPIDPSTGLPFCDDVATSFMTLATDADSLDSESTTGNIEVWRRLENPFFWTPGDQNPNSFQVSQDRQSQDDSLPNYAVEDDGKTRVPSKDNLLGRVCRQNSDSDKTGLLRLRVTVKSNVTTGDDFVEETRLNTLAAVRYSDDG